LGHKFISKKKKTQNLNSSNNQQGKSISKFDTQSDNLENYQDMADSSLKVSQLQKLQDTANVNPIQLNPENDGNVTESGELPFNIRDSELPSDGSVHEKGNVPEWRELSVNKRISILDKATKGDITEEVATYLKRMGRDSELPDPEVLYGLPKVQAHLAKFEGGASRFDTPVNYNANRGSDEIAGRGMGRDFVFLTTNAEADEVQRESTKPFDPNEAKPDEVPGIWHMEKRLGADEGRWVDESLGGTAQNSKNIMWRTDIPDPKHFNLAMVKGNEMDAFREEWKAGGKTLGGINEAKISKISFEKLAKEISDEHIKPKPVEFKETPKKNIKKGSGEQTT